MSAPTKEQIERWHEVLEASLPCGHPAHARTLAEMRSFIEGAAEQTPVAALSYVKAYLEERADWPGVEALIADIDRQRPNGGER
jgi:hypothetical protein